jgi:tetratricopeptide (TPR) repeat protein
MKQWNTQVQRNNKKHWLLFLVMAAFFSQVFAQNPIKPDLNYLSKIVEKSKESTISTDELIKAKKMVDLGIDDPVFSRKTEFWYLRGSVYRLIYESPIIIEGLSKEDALGAMSISYRVAIDKGPDVDRSSFAESNEIQNLWGSELNKGVNAYNRSQFDEAIKHFTYTTYIKPNDTTGYLYAASCATEIQKWDIVQSNYQNLVKISPTEDYYLALISVQYGELKNINAAYLTIEESKTKLESQSKEIILYELDVLRAMDRNEEANALLRKAIVDFPNDPSLYLRLALLNDRIARKTMEDEAGNRETILAQWEKAEQTYLRLIELMPEHIIAYYNLSILKNDLSEYYFQTIKAMDAQEISSLGREFESKVLQLKAEAVEWMEKARQIDPEDPDILFALRKFYTENNHAEKLNEINTTLSQLGYD